MSTVSEIESVSKQGKVLTVLPTDSVAYAAQEMSRYHVGCMLVTDEDMKIVGILTERDIVAKVVGRYLDANQVRIQSIMTQKVMTCEMGTSISEVQQIMAVNKIRHLPIIDNEKPIGMISSRDVLTQQLVSVQAIAHRQSMVFDQLEKQYPGISNVVRDPNGRIMI